VEGGAVRRMPIGSTLITASLAVACAGSPPPAVPSPAQPGANPPTTVTPAAAPTRDSTSATLVPAGFGTLRQEDIAIVLETSGVRISAIPLDESVIRTLAPDSYRVLRSYREEHRQRATQRASMHGIREPRIWYVRFDGLAPDAHFVPTDLTVTSGGRDFRPVDVVPLTSGFGEQRLQPRETQRGLLIFDEAVDPSQPLVVSVGIVRNVDWDYSGAAILKKLDNERASIRARASARP